MRLVPLYALRQRVRSAFRIMNSNTLKRNSRGRSSVWPTLGLLFVAAPLAAATAHVYVANRGGTTIDVIDTTTNKVVEVIKGIESPEVIRFSPDGSRLYITSRSEDVLDVRDRKSGKAIKKGDKVVMWYRAANFDEEAVPDPYRFAR